MRSSVPVTNRRRILCVFPRYTPAFGTFNHAYRLMKGVRAFMPPQGLLLIAAYMPQRGRSASSTRTSAGDRGRFRLGRCCDGQRHARSGAADPRDRRPRACGRQGGDVGWAVGIGIAGDVRGHRLSAHRRNRGCHRRAHRAPRREHRSAGHQLRFETTDRLPLHDFPLPAYDMIPLTNYLMRRCNSRPAVPISASSAIFRTFTAGSHGSRRLRRSRRTRCHA